MDAFTYKTLVKNLVDLIEQTRKKRIWFYLGLIVFYLLIYFAPNKVIYFGAYLLALPFFYLDTKSIKLSLVYSLVLSLFSDIGIAGAWFLMEPKELSLGSGWWISPMTLLLFFIVPISLKNKLDTEMTDIFIIFYLLAISLTFLFFPYQNVLFGYIKIVEVFIAYLIFRTYLSKKNINKIFLIISSMLVFQLAISSMQLIKKSPINILAESVLVENPHGLVAVEEESLFRLSGTFGHPNHLASFLLAVIPFLLFFKSKKKLVNYFKILSFIILFFTFSRIAWVIGAGYLLLYFILHQKHKINYLRFIKKESIYYILPILLLLLSIFPYFSTRLETFSLAFEEYGSMGVRLKLTQEAVGLIKRFPLTGVGLNRSLEIYSQYPFSNLFDTVKPTSFYRIHNTLLEIATETGLPALLFFLLFIFYVFKYYLNNKDNFYKQVAFFGLCGLFIISLFNPLLHSTQFRFFFLLAAIILV